MTPTDATQEIVLEFARFAGPGAMVYPSPRPDEAKDLVMPAMKWVQVDPAFRYSGTYARDKKAGVFESLQADSTPTDVDLAIGAQWEYVLGPDQRELIRSIVLSFDDPLPDHFRKALEITRLLDDSGLPVSEHVTVTLDYVRTRHRPFLMALREVEERHQKRPSLLKIIKKQLDRIESLPGK